MKRIVISAALLIAAMGMKAENKIIVDKPAYMLYVVEENDTVFSAPVCLGKNLGQKKRAGDHKTPEGNFKVSMVQDASKWTHDFKDGHGKRKGAYGPWFFRLNTPQSSHIGIHGTCFPESMGKRESDGCIRLRNEDLLQLKEFIKVGTPVTVLPD